ncbi:Arf-gap domain and fg repeat-containing protein [Thalictrum thalictroides]|uniref:Arf-gap domain and fg repeat-containing protein n=1 Tax=Thalictrum thalictroides TaxID=46969 RepID=A0A7J6X560_THATH|nr:Arf-gap domain and fg repeat-containing protein [Thalictrum thalictroides]
MSSRKEEERNEKIIRGLMKLPPNRRCINCNSLGPQYVCTNFWTFVCTTCSGIHREFTHRVKSVSMAKFTSQEVEALQRGGNQRAREMFLKDWDLQRQRLPDSSNVDRVRGFIKNVYEDRKYAGGKVLDKPPRDMQNLRNQEDETRRASSYHSYSQSPPYEYQYEDRKYGKQVGVLSRKPGSDRGYYEGKTSSLAYSPGRLAEQMYEDKFANEGSNSRASDYSVSSLGDPFRSDNQSPTFQGKLSSPPRHPLKDLLVESSQIKGALEPNAKKGSGGTTRTQRTTSSGSFGSFDSNSVNSGSFVDVVSEPEQSAGTQLGGRAPVLSVQKSSVSVYPVGIDLFTAQLTQQPTGFSSPSIDLFEKPASSTAPSQDLFKPSDINVAPAVDLFADITHLSSVASSEPKPPAASFQQDDGWATFDVPQHEVSTFGIKFAPHVSTAHGDQASSMNSSLQWPSVTNESHGLFPSVENQWHSGGHEVQPFGVPTSTKGGQLTTPIDQKSTNPFDLPYDSNLEASSMFLNMSSLQAALPESQLPPSYAEGFSQPWFSSDTMTPYIPAAPQGGLAYLTGEAPNPQFPNIPSQASVASLSGNPFA